MNENNIKPHNQLYWKNRKEVCQNPECTRTKGMTPEQITNLGIPHQGYGLCSTCYGIYKKLGKLPKKDVNFAEQEIYKEIGKRIKHAREIEGISQRELSEKVGYKSLGTISAIEAGHTRIQLKELQKVAKVLRRDVNYFFGANYQLPNLKTYLREMCIGLDEDDVEEICQYVEILQKTKELSKSLIA